MFFIAGGSGITPIFQTLIELAAMKEEVIELILLFANKAEDDIVLRKELESHSNRIRLHYILDQPPAHWPHLKGHITPEVLTSICPLDDPETLYVHCGPFGMNKLIRDLFQHSYPKSLLFKF
jgi:cytochrome-b5 reductase